MSADTIAPDTPAVESTAATDTVLAGLVRHVTQAAANHGLPHDELLRMAGITPELLADTNGRVPVLLLERLVAAAVEVSGDILVGLHMSQATGPAGFGVTGYIRQACATLREVIEMTMRYERLVSDIGTTTLLHQPGIALWCWSCRTDNDAFRRQAVEYLLGCWVGIQLRLLQQQPPPVLAVHLPHPAPERAELRQEYERIFGCPVRFEQAEAALVLSASVLNLPLSHPDPDLQETLEQHARQLLSQRKKEYGFADAVRGQLRLQLHQGQASCELLAESLGISSRQLRRQLDKVGSSYRELLDELRMEMALGFLRDAGISIEEVSQRLRFSEIQSFIRWFKAIKGVTPAEFRKGKE